MANALMTTPGRAPARRPNALEGYASGVRGLYDDAVRYAQTHRLAPDWGAIQDAGLNLVGSQVRAMTDVGPDGKLVIRPPDEYVGNLIKGAVDPTPIIRDVVGTYRQARRSGSTDDWKKAVLAGGGALMAITPAGKARGAKGALRGAEEAERIATAGARGARGIINTPDLRRMSTEDAVAAARAQPHLMPASDGTYIGGPSHVRSPADLEAMRARFDEDVALGAEGGQWYPLERQFNREVAGPDPSRQSLLAREEGLWSAQASPDTNMNFLLQGHNAYEAGNPLDKVRTGAQARTYQEARAAGEPIPLGKKTGVYAQHLDPTVEHATTGTNDIWHARAFGYTNTDGSTFSRALTPQEHRFLDYETMLAVDRANAKGLGGRTDWQAHEVQAAPWVAGKGRSLAATKFGVDPENLTPDQLQWGVREAAKSYKDYADKYTAFGTYEAQPYVEGGHLPGLARQGSEADRAAFAADPASTWANPEGRDVLYDAAGVYQRPTQPATGIYTPPIEGAATETNPAFVARPLVGVTEGAVDPASREIMDHVEALRAYADVQGAGAWHKPIANAPPTQMNSVTTSLNRPLTLPEINALTGRGRESGLPSLLDSGQGFTMTSFADTPPTSADVAKSLRSGLTRDVGQIVPDAGVPRRAKIDSGYAGYEGAWEQGEGSGAATRALLEQMKNPSIEAKLDTPEVRQRILDKVDRDQALSQRTGDPVRADVQRARNILATEGIAGLRRALERGEALPAIVVSALAGAAGLSALAGQRDEPGA